MMKSMSPSLCVCAYKVKDKEKTKRQEKNINENCRIYVKNPDYRKMTQTNKNVTLKFINKFKSKFTLKK